VYVYIDIYDATSVCVYRYICDFNGIGRLSDENILQTYIST
jgi:hypothetical protein